MMLIMLGVSLARLKIGSLGRAGVLAIAVGEIGVLAKLYAEAIENTCAPGSASPSNISRAIPAASSVLPFLRGTQT